jgi:hypothetical protein
MRFVRLDLAILVLALLTLGACGGGPAEPTLDGVRALVEVQVDRVDDGIRITNSRATPIAYAVWNRGWLALFAPCTSTEPDCPRLQPGASITIPIEEIDGWDAGATEAIVRWWTVEPDGNGGVRASEVRDIIIAI